jgi:predicted CopG family antitoxin
MVTTIQLSESLKEALSNLKDEKETFEQVIIKLFDEHNQKIKDKEQLLEEQCKEMYSDMVEINSEWENTETEVLE